MATCDQTGTAARGSAAPAARVVEGRPDGGCTQAFELICCELGDHPDLGNCEVSPGFQRIRGLCPIAAGVAAHEKHVGLHCQPAGAA